MLAIIRMIVVLASICGLSGFALSYLKISTAPRIEEQVLTYVQGPAILKVFADIDNSPIAERKTFTLDGAKVTVTLEKALEEIELTVYTGTEVKKVTIPAGVTEFTAEV